jgi:RNA polymerase-binding transcription factor DksA
MDADEARALLEAERRRLLVTRDALAMHAGPLAGTQRDDTGELSGMDEHLADVASDTLEREVDLTVLHSLDADLAAVGAALERVDGGSYGLCAACGAAIGESRLRALPAATRCLAHQVEAEAAHDALRQAVLAARSDVEAAAHLDLLPVE